MSKRIIWTEEARADVRSIDRKTALDLLHGLARFAATESGDVKQLQNVEPRQLRLRLGDYRIRFQDLGQEIKVLAVKHRRDAYR